MSVAEWRHRFERFRSHFVTSKCGPHENRDVFTDVKRASGGLEAIRGIKMLLRMYHCQAMFRLSEETRIERAD